MNNSKLYILFGVLPKPDDTWTVVMSNTDFSYMRDALRHFNGLPPDKRIATGDLSGVDYLFDYFVVRECGARGSGIPTRQWDEELCKFLDVDPVTKEVISP